MSHLVTLNVEAGVATVTFNRPDKLNALSYESFLQLARIIKQLKKDKSLRLVIIDAIGSDFCTGLDVKNISRSPTKMLKLLFKWLPGNANLAQQVTIGWQEIKAPVICKIHGRCFGGGMQIALGADFRLASRDAQFAIMESRWGLTPDMAGSVMLQGLMPYDQALKLTHMAEPISADTAKTVNLVTQVCDDLDLECEQLKAALLAQSPDALAANKRTYQKRMFANRRPLLAAETFNQIRILRGKNVKRAISNRLKGETKPFDNSANW
ncbi:1,2-epoxyphenylacetyl-CoA isomerase [Pseudoalteromonas sp. P1-9]|uniref:crotonase/enoyl-CoA hydratase family protein n=1 Tax=Pseudoalteromonas sp. P1-9 TaxID=1710354 RepID=UPI0006D5FD8F|nr:crotonase/enoyl-CoA hydratase family protein [Pseudoalteromonas sp. P1-9]KPV97391.1 1,2-epoxyphenylacetyl-CoA isomerase [Pseudoalteromonas sp. P1-9]